MTPSKVFLELNREGGKRYFQNPPNKTILIANINTERYANS